MINQKNIIKLFIFFKKIIKKIINFGFYAIF